MADKIKILFDSFHLYHLPQFDPVIDLLSKDDRFQIFHSTAAVNKKEERELCLNILATKPGTMIYSESEEERAKMMKELDLDFFVCELLCTSAGARSVINRRCIKIPDRRKKMG